jgi:hypothetical protein
MEILNKQIRNTKFPHTFNRKCPEIKNKPKTKFKSSELKNWLFFLSVPLTFKKLPRDHWLLHCLYVIAIRILYEPIEKRRYIEKARKMLEIYHDSLKDFYGKHAYTINMHLHLHLADEALEHGPLHGRALFNFEVSEKFIFYNHKKINE